MKRVQQIDLEDVLEALGIDARRTGIVQVIKEHMRWLVDRGILAEEYEQVGDKRLIYYRLPLPAGPKDKPRGRSPEAMALQQVGRLKTPPRGEPVRTSNADKRRKMLQQPGVSLRVRTAEKRREKMDQAREERAAAARAKMIKQMQEGGGTKKKTKRSSRTHST